MSRSLRTSIGSKRDHGEDMSATAVTGSQSKRVNSSLLTVLVWLGTTSSTAWRCELRRVEHELEQQEHIEEAVLTLSTPDEVSLTP
jgi:hypothetical protein